MYRPASVPRTSRAAVFDACLRRHMLGIYNNMGAALAITGAVALLVAGTPALATAKAPESSPS